MMKRSFALLALMALGCSKGRAPAPPVASASVSVSAVPREPIAIASAAKTASCRTDGPIATVDDRRDNGMKLENLRVLADERTTVLTWERQSEDDMGDSFREPVVARRQGTGEFATTTLPVEAYACATYGLIAPNTIADPVLAWGVRNEHGFQIWSGFPKSKNTPAASTFHTTKHEVRSFAASGGVTVSVTTDIQCDAFCECGDTGAKHGVWIHGLEEKHRVAEPVMSRALDKNPPDAPAIARSDKIAAYAYRDRGALWVGFLGAHGKPNGKPVELDEGSVGAPALATAGDKVVAVWSKRATNDAPYTLRWATLRVGEPIAASDIPAPTESAFAAAVIADERRMVVAFMSGDAGTKGSIWTLAHAFDDDAWPAHRVSPDSETNARDPELSGTVAHPTLAYALFDAPRVGGIVRVTSLACD